MSFCAYVILREAEAQNLIGIVSEVRGFDPSPSGGGECSGRREYIPVGFGLGVLPRTPAALTAARRRLT